MGHEKGTSYQTGMTALGIYSLTDHVDLKVQPLLLVSMGLLTFRN